MTKQITSIADILPDRRNANKGTARGSAMLEQSLRKYGAGRSIVVDRDAETIGGAKTLEAAALLGLPVRVVQSDGKELIVVQRTDLDLDTDTEARELAIADNRIGSVSLEWDTTVLASLGAEIDLSTFWTKDELAALIVEDVGTGGGDEVPVVEDGPTRTQYGELWACGRHRILVGDSRDAEQVARLMQGERADILLTDPPYGIGIVKGGTAGNFPGTHAPRHQAIPIEGDDEPFDPSHLLGLSGALVLFGGNYYADKLPAGSKWLVWDKKDGAFQGSDLGDCELAWTNLQGTSRLLHHTWQGMYRKGEGERAAREHPTQKPVALMEWCLDQAAVSNGAIVLDPYLGSGTTLIACHRTGRRCFGIEIEPRYADVILKRFEAESGLVAERID